VDQHHQRRGLGREILTYAEDYCRRVWGMKKLDLDVLYTRQALLAWYMRCGCQKTREIVPFPGGLFKCRILPEGLHLINLEKDLNTAPVAAGAA
jgi:ribosomal protein S18 acetylase RimI-like enzyme